MNKTAEYAGQEAVEVKEQVTPVITAGEFLANNLVILKGDRKDGKGTYETIIVSKSAMWNSSVCSIADMFGVKTIDKRTSK